MRLILLGLSLVGCPDSEDSRFQVVDSFPVSGATVDAQDDLWIRFSEPHDVEACGEGSVHLLRLGQDGRVVAQIGHRVRQDTVVRVSVEHDGLESGFTYRLSVQTGSSGCRSAFGEQIRPFVASFVVQ